MSLVIVATLLFCFLAAAQEAVPLPASEVKAQVAINNEMIEINSSEWEGKNLSPADLLATYPGIQTRQRGGMGSFQTVSIRGMQGNQIAVAIDGVILQSLGATDLGGIDLNQYEKIEIYKSYIPAKFAANGMGGVINFVSKDAAAKTGKFYASYGSYNSRILSMQANSPLTNSVFWTSNISCRASDNDFPYLNRNGTQYNTDDDFWTKRKNAQYSQISGNHSFRLAQNKINSVFRVEHNSAAGGIPGREDQETKTANSAADAILASYEIESFPLLESLSFGIQAFTGLEKNMSAWYYPLDKIGYSVDEYTQSGILLKSGGGQGSFYFEKEKIKTEFHAHYNYQYLESRNKSEMLNDYEFSNSFLQFSFAGELVPIDFFNIKANAAIRLNKEKQEKGRVSGFFMGSDYEGKERILESGRISMNFGNENSLWSSIAAGHYFRAPSLVELFSTSFGILSNPNLKEEQGEQAEWSVGYRHKKTRILATAFANRIRDLIVYHTSGQLSKPINSGNGEIYGIEAELYSEPFKWLKISSNATFQNPGTLPNEPKGQSYSSMIFMLPYSFELRLEGEAHSDLYRDEAQRKKIPEKAFYHAGFSYKPTAASTIFFSARNINGAEYQNIYDASPTPGRIFTLSYWHYF
jgi:outer membrane cobalamin receptor